MWFIWLIAPIVMPAVIFTLWIIWVWLNDRHDNGMGGFA